MSDKSDITIFDVADRLQAACKRLIRKCPNCGGKGVVVIMGESYGDCPECSEARDAVEFAESWIAEHM